MIVDSAILVVGPSWVGDMVMAQCLFAALKRQSADVSIDVLAPDWARPVLARMTEVRDSIQLPFGHGELALRRRAALGRSLRGRYSHAYVLPGSWKSAVVPFAAHVPHRCGYLREWRFGVLNDIRALPSDKRHKTATIFQALADPEVFAEPARLIEPVLAVDTKNRDRLLTSHGLTAARYAALAPGSEFGPAKRWPTHHWVQLVDLLAARGLRSALLGSAEDCETTRGIAELRPDVIDLGGLTRLEDAIDLLSAARLAVTNDSGLMHVAAAVGTEIIAIYGATSPNHTPPLSARAGFASLSLACSPCGKRTCPLGHLDCLMKLEPARVMAQIDAISARC